MKYVMLIMDTPESLAQYETNKEWFGEVAAWYEKVGASGKLADSGAQLQPAATAKTVRSTGVTDGPFIEVKEIVGGYSIVQADTLDAAAELAKGCPIFLRGGSVEVRPLQGLAIGK